MASTSDILVDDNTNKPASMHAQAPSDPTNNVASWITERVDSWIRYRDENFKDKWNEYYRLWRGIWSSKDKTRKSERSRIIAPALQQAIESTVAELEEATFGRVRWLDLQDNRADSDTEDMEFLNKQLLEDFEIDGVKSAISETYLNGALYGTGIAKIVIDETREFVLDPNNPEGPGRAPVVIPKDRVRIKLIPIEPMNFAIDPVARNIDDAMGCAHIMLVPRHTITKKQQEGIYKKGQFGAVPEGVNDIRNTTGKVEFGDTSPDEKVKITEYHGLVPARFIKDTVPDENVISLFESDEDQAKATDIDGEELMEAIVTVANDSFVLKAVENPHIMKDRSIISYQHDTVPNRFFGRGVSEKGYNSQKALDAEMRARIDGLSFSNNPMIGIDVASLPRGNNNGMAVHPGKTIITNGNPRESLFPIQFPGPDPNTYRQTGELERMIQMGTGSMDSATPTGINPRNNTASGMSMMLAGAIKRQKRTMQNVERHFLDQLVKKCLWRYMDFDPERYPVKDYKFVVHCSMGIMAREFEQQQLSNLLNTVPPDSPAYWLILDSIYENSSLANKEQARKLIQSFMEKTLNPPKPEESPEFQFKMQELELKKKELEDNMFIEAQSHARLTNGNTLKEQEMQYKFGLDVAEKQIMLERAKSERIESESEAVMNIAKAESQEVGNQLAAYIDRLKDLQSTAETKIGSVDDMREQVEGILTAISAMQEKQASVDDSLGGIRKELGSTLQQPAVNPMPTQPVQDVPQPVPNAPPPVPDVPQL